MTSVSFQGERGAYSEAAAKSFFDDNIQTIPLPTFSEMKKITLWSKLSVNSESTKAVKIRNNPVNKTKERERMSNSQFCN